MTIRDIAIAFGYEVDKNSEKKVNDSIDKLKSAATKALGAIGIGFSLVNANAVIEEFGKINAQIKLATGNLEDQKEIQNEIVAAANSARMAYSDIAGFTSKLVQENRELFDVSSAAKYAELTSKLFKSENQSSSDILALQDAINKSFAKGAVEADTINQLLEKSPAAAELLSKEIGVSRTELATLASDGRISLEQLRDAFLNNAEDIEKAFSNVDLTISDALLNIRNQWGLWLTQMDKTLGITNTIAKIMTRTFDKIMTALRKVQTWTERVTKAVGGAENMLKLLAIAAGAIFLAFNAGKILSFLKDMGTAIKSINFKALAIAAVIALILLAIEDFINFMQGNDSVIGLLFEKWGLDADEVRKSIIKTWEAVKAFLSRTWDAIKTIFGNFVTVIVGLITGDLGKAFDGLKGMVSGLFDYIEDAFGKFAPVVKAVVIAFAAWKTIDAFTNLAKGVITVVKSTAAFISHAAAVAQDTIAMISGAEAQTLWNGVAKTGQAITRGLGSAFKFLVSPAGLAIIAIAALIAIIVALIRNGGDVDALVQQFSDGLNKFVDIVEKVITGISEKLPQIIEAIVNIIVKILGAIIDKLPIFIDAGIKLVTMLISGLAQMLPVIIEAVLKLVTALVTAIINIAPTLISAGIKLVVALIEGIVSMLPAIIDAVIQLVMSLVTAIADMLPKIIEAGIALIVALIDGIVSAIPDIIKAVIEIIPTIISAIIKSVPKILAAGMQIIVALVQGIFKIIPQILKAGIEIVLALVKGIIQAIPQILRAIPQIVGSVLDGLKQLFPGLAPIFDGVKKHFELVFNTIASVFEKVINIIKTVFSIFKSLFTGDWKGLWEGIKSYFSQIWDLIAGIFKGIFDIFKNVLSTFGNFFKGIWDGIVNFFKGILNGIANFYKAVWDGICSYFQNLWNGILNFFTGIWEAINGNVSDAGETIKSIFTAVGDFFKSIWNSIVDFFKGIWGDIPGFFKGIWDNLVGVVQSAADKIMGFFKPVLDLIGNVKDAVSGAVEGAKDFVGGAVDKVKETAGNVAGGVKDFASGAAEKVKSFVGFAKGTNSTPDTFIAGEEGPELITGAKGRKVFTSSETDGIVGAIGNALKVASNVVKAAKDVISGNKSDKKDTGSSPDINANITVKTDGDKGGDPNLTNIGSVIKNAFSWISEKASQVSEQTDSNAVVSAINELKSVVSVLASSSTARAGTVQTTVSNTSNRNVTQNNYFENTFNGDRAGQKKSSEAMSKSTDNAAGELARALAYAR